VARALAILLAAVAPALTVVGCALQAEKPPDAAAAPTVPEVVPVSGDVQAADRVTLPRLARDSAERRASRLTVRVRNVSCEGVSTGSGFALAPDILITNRHVLAGADTLEVSTWDGRTYEISSASVGVLGDLGVAVVDGRLPLVARFGPPPQAGDLVTAVGYPLGGPLTLSEGAVVDRVDGEHLNVPGEVVRLTARVRPGNSGGPVLDHKGEVVGIVYAIELETRFGLAIPVDTLRSLARVGGYEDVPPCGEE
jgi:S1-C subfamily serine protease